jgi:hypothetical protein
MRILFAKFILSLCSPTLVFAQSADSTGPGRLTGVSPNLSQTIAAATATANPNTIQAWLDANAGRRFLMSGYGNTVAAVYDPVLYVYPDRACHGGRPYPGGPESIVDCRTIAEPSKSYSGCAEVNACWTLSYSLSPYGWIGDGSGNGMPAFGNLRVTNDTIQNGSTPYTRF